VFPDLVDQPPELCHSRRSKLARKANDLAESRDPEPAQQTNPSGNSQHCRVLASALWPHIRQHNAIAVDPQPSAVTPLAKNRQAAGHTAVVGTGASARESR